MEHSIDRVIILPSKGNDFREELNDCQEQIKNYFTDKQCRIVQQSFFIDVSDNAAYVSQSRLISDELKARSLNFPPTSIIAQIPALGHRLSVELLIIHNIPESLEINYRQLNGIRYTCIEAEDKKEIYIGGITAGNTSAPFKEQVEKAYKLLDAVLKKEGMDFGNICHCPHRNICGRCNL